jgi:hypothetical protein
MFLLAVGVEGAGLTLTGVSVYDSAGTSGSILSGGWNNTCVGVAQLTLTGFPGCPPTIDISTLGQYTLTYTTSGNLPGQFANLELFFNGDTYAPGIHVVIDQNTPTPTLIVPDQFQQCLQFNCAPNPPGPGSLTYASGGLVVTAEQFTETDPTGVWTGTIQFSVADASGVPEPASVVLVSLALLAAPIVLRCRARR